MHLFPYQVQGAEFLASRKAALLADEMGLGKAQPLDAKVLTPSGWMRMGDLKTGDMVVGGDGRSTRIKGIFPQGEKRVYNCVFTDGSRTQCCEEHLWSVRTPNQKFRGTPFETKSLRYIKDHGLKQRNGNLRWYIPVVPPVQFKPNGKLPVHPYLLGILIGDGCLSGSGVRFSKGDDAHVDIIRKFLPEGISLSSSKKSRGSQTHNLVRSVANGKNQAVSTIKELKLNVKSNSKHIPSQYLLSSVENREFLLQGLLDTDGYVSKSGHVIEYSTASNRLMDDFAFLVQSLGGVCYRSAKKVNGVTYYRCNVSLPPEIKPFLLPRKRDRHLPKTKYPPSRGLAKITPAGMKKTQCISVENKDGLYITDDFIVTHNTAQALHALDLIGAKSVLVVCPATVRFVWEKEFERFSRTFRDAKVVMDRYAVRHIHQTKAAIVSYEFATRYLTAHNVRFDALILDEAHFLKERTTRRSKAIFGNEGVVRGIKKAIWALTGTPMPNNPAELWPLLYTFRATELKYKDFVSEFCVMEYSAFAPGRERIAGVKPEKARELHESLLKKVMLRRLKKDILTDLPPILFSEVPVEEDDKLLLEMEEGNIEDMREEESKLAEMIDNASDKAAAILAGATGYMRLRRYTGLKKAKAVADIIEEELSAGAYPKIVVFGIHKQVISYLESRLSSFGVAKITGDVPMSKRKEEMRRFQEDPNVKVFIGNILSAGTGITLTASNQVFFCEQDFVPGNNRQAADRCHRIGQKSNVLVRIAVLKGSLDEEIGYILTRKMRDIRAIIDGESLTTESDDSTSITSSENNERDEVSFLFS